MSKLFVCDDGHMYDTSRCDWHKLPPLRTNYAKVDREFPPTPSGSIALRAALRQRYAWPGGYAFVFITNDGAYLCSTCVRDNYREVAADRRGNYRGGWAVMNMTLEDELETAAYCEHCGKRLNQNDYDEDADYDEAFPRVPYVPTPEMVKSGEAMASELIDVSISELKGLGGSKVLSGYSELAKMYARDEICSVEAIYRAMVQASKNESN